MSGKKRPGRPGRHEMQIQGIISQGQWDKVAQMLKLSPRQADICQEILSGAGDKQIAAVLGITLPTVRTHLSRLFNKLAVQDRAELVLLIMKTKCQICSDRPPCDADCYPE